MTEDTPLTISVPEAGRRYFGLSRNASYMAAARGELPTVRIGRLLRVPVRALEHMLDKATEIQNCRLIQFQVCQERKTRPRCRRNARKAQQDERDTYSTSDW